MDYTKIAEHYLNVICVSDDFQNSNPINNRDLLFPDFNDLIEELLTRYDEVNNDNDCPYIYETFRSHALQNIYYFRGATKIRGGNILTAGMHHFGVAVDIINLVDKNGNKIKDRGESVDWNNIDYVTMRHISRELGIYDLGSYEVCHFQMIPTSEQSTLRQSIYQEVLNFQRANGLKADGIIGPKTIAKLKS